MKFLVPEQEEMVPGTERLYFDCQEKCPNFSSLPMFSDSSMMGS